ncbi:hypothetical protein ACHQM5_019216 [Ranunculus cassubicifolius]
MLGTLEELSPLPTKRRKTLHQGLHQKIVFSEVARGKNTLKRCGPSKKVEFHYNSCCRLPHLSLLVLSCFACMWNSDENFSLGKSGKQSHLAELQKSDIRKDPHGTATSLFCNTSNFDSSSSNITEVSYTNHAHEGCESQESLTHFPGTQKSVSSFPAFLGKIKAEILDSDSEIHNANGMKSLVTNRKNVFVKSEMGTCEESDEHVIDHMILRQRKELLLSGRKDFNIDCAKNLKCLRKTLPSAFQASSDIPQPDKPEPILRQKRKRKRTATDSVETALEEDAPGLLKVLFDRGILLDEIKLYGVGVDGDDLLDISSEDDSFGDLENVVSKLFSQKSPILKLAPLTKRNASKTYYCLACLLSLVEQTRYLIYRKWPVEWGWCRDLQSFIFVFERHNRIVLERPEYGFATYFFELVDSLPIDWQIKRLVTAMKLTSCSRTTLIENKPLLVGEDLTEGEARVLEEYGWTPNTGLGSMLNYCDRVVHDRKNEAEDVSDWRTKIGKLLMNGLDGGTIVLDKLPKKFKGYNHIQEPTVQV